MITSKTKITENFEIVILKKEEEEKDSLEEKI